MLNAQNSEKADSLRELFNSRELVDTFKLKVLHDLMIFEGRPNQALLYAQSFTELAQKLSNIRKVAQGWEEMSLIYRRLGNIPASTSAALNAQSIFKQQGLIYELAASHAQLASNLALEERHIESIEEYKEALQVYQQQKDTVRTCLTLLNIGEVFRLEHELDSALNYFQESLKLNVSRNKIVHGYATGNLGLVYQKLKVYAEAQPLLEEAIELLEELGDLYSVSVYTFELGNVFIQTGSDEMGEKGMLKAYEIALDQGFKEQIRDFSESLTKYYQSKSNFKKALHFQQQYQVYKDSLINIDNVRQVEQVKGQYEVNQREVEISLLNQITHSQQQMVLGLSSGTILLVLLLGLLYYNNQQKKKANIALAQREKEKALLLRELNHRTKNNLQMISSLLNLQSQSLEGHPAAAAVREGRYRVDSLALIHQKLCIEDYSHLNMKQYLQELIDHLGISFNPEIKIEANIVACQMSVNQAIPLALIVNELLTNALKYGCNPDEPEHKIWVTLQNDKGQYCLAIRDNGPGMKKPDITSLQSFGLILIYSLVEQLDGDIQFDGANGAKWKINFVYD